jgi:hypothetical protein
MTCDTWGRVLQAQVVDVGGASRLREADLYPDDVTDASHSWAWVRMCGALMPMSSRRRRPATDAYR